MLKKIISSIVLAGCIAAGLWAEPPKNVLSFNIDFPQMKYKIDDSADAKLDFSGGGFDFTGLVMLKNNLCIPITAGISGITTSDIKIAGDNIGGPLLKLGAGLGYAVVNTDKFTLALSGILGLDYFTTGPIKEEYVGSYKREYTLELTEFTIGADLFGAIRLGDNMGLSAGIRVQTCMFGSAKIKIDYSYGYTDSDNTWDLKGGRCSVIPRIGLSCYL